MISTAWEWRCSNREAGEITTRITAGLFISAQKRLGPGSFQLLVRVAKNPPRGVIEKITKRAQERVQPLVSNYGKMLEGR